MDNLLDDHAFEDSRSEFEESEEEIIVVPRNNNNNVIVYKIIFVNCMFIVR